MRLRPFLESLEPSIANCLRGNSLAQSALGGCGLLRRSTLARRSWLRFAPPRRSCSRFTPTLTTPPLKAPFREKPVGQARVLARFARQNPSPPEVKRCLPSSCRMLLELYKCHIRHFRNWIALGNIFLPKNVFGGGCDRITGKYPNTFFFNICVKQWIWSFR